MKSRQRYTNVKKRQNIQNKYRNKKNPLVLSFSIVITFLALLLFLFFGTISIICLGPSTSARDLFVNTVMETSAAKFLARIYFSDDQINDIITANTAHISDLITNTDSIVLPTDDTSFDLDAITVEDVKGANFVGKMMIVNDPSRLFVATVPNFSESSSGLLLTDLITQNNAIAGINGGAFDDPNGVGKGGMPLGVVIQNGVITCNTTPDAADVIIGFDTDHKLIVGNMTADQAIAKGIVEGVSFGPALIINGERVPISGSGGGLNPRTAIGQCQNGSVLMLVIDGRQAQSLGASYKDIADVMLEYGAVNAGNLDGGSSSMMILNDEVLNNRSTLIGPRKIPTAFLVQ